MPFSSKMKSNHNCYFFSCLEAFTSEVFRGFLLPACSKAFPCLL